MLLIQKVISLAWHRVLFCILFSKGIVSFGLICFLLSSFTCCILNVFNWLICSNQAELNANSFLQFYYGTFLSLQTETLLQLQYFPHEGTIDRMYFPYYGKKSHVSSSLHVLTHIMIKERHISLYSLIM